MSMAKVMEAVNGVVDAALMPGHESQQLADELKRLEAEEWPRVQAGIERLQQQADEAGTELAGLLLSNSPRAKGLQHRIKELRGLQVAAKKAFERERDGVIRRLEEITRPGILRFKADALEELKAVQKRARAVRTSDTFTVERTDKKGVDHSYRKVSVRDNSAALEAASDRVTSDMLKANSYALRPVPEFLAFVEAHKRWYVGLDLEGLGPEYTIGASLAKGITATA